MSHLNRRLEIANALVMTDSVSCIPDDLARANGIKVIPASNISFGDQTYLEGVTISASEAYDLIKKDPDSFVTSAVTPGYLLDEFRRAREISPNLLHITLSSAMSAGFQTACLAAEQLKQESPETDIRVFDSKTVSGAQALIVLTVAKMAATGTNMDELMKIAERARRETGGFMFLDTLRYIYRTGRMSKTAARLASILNIKPINRVTESGEVELVDRVRKRSDGFKKLTELIRKESKTDSLHFMVSHANAPEIGQAFAEQLKQEFDCLSMIISDYSPVMGYGAGPAAIFVGFQPQLDFTTRQP